MVRYADSYRFPMGGYGGGFAQWLFHPERLVDYRTGEIAGDPSYECMSDGSLSGAGSFWTGGEESGGLSDLFSIYAGAGYGWRTLMWKDIDGEWAMVSFRHLAISAGISSVSFKTASFVCGLGFCF